MTNNYGYTPQTTFVDPQSGYWSNDLTMGSTDSQRFIPGVPFLGGLLLGSLIAPRPYFYGYPTVPFAPYPYPLYRPYPYMPYYGRPYYGMGMYPHYR